MEILQTIWTALTTENEVLLFIISIPFTVLEIMLTTLLFTTILNISSTFKQKVLYVLSFSLISILSGVFLPAPYNTFVNVVACPLLVLFIFRASIFKAIMAEVLPLSVFTIISILLHNLALLIFDVTSNTLNSIPICRILFSSCSYALVFTIYLILKHFNFNIYIFDNMQKNSTLLLLINFVFGILAICLQSYIATLYSDNLPFYLTILNLGTLFVYFVYSLFSLVRTNKLEQTERDLEQSKRYIKTLTILHDNIRCFKHDFSNIVATIGRLCTDK